MCSPRQSSCYWTRSNIRRQATLLLKLLPTNESLPPATIPLNQMNTFSHIQHSHFLLSFSFSTPLTTLALLTIAAYLLCLSCVSVAYWLRLKNANVMYYIKALGFPLMPPTEEMDPAQLINLETQSTGSIQRTRGMQVCLREKQIWPFHTHCSNSLCQWVWAHPWISHAMFVAAAVRENPFKISWTRG